MKDFPLIFSGPMVQANRKGIKRMTRRVVDMDRLWVVMRKDVRPDFPLLLRPEQRNMLAPAGAKLRGVIHGAGAVSCRLPAGGTLGVKPGEFDFVCPYAQGETVLATAGGKNTWTLIPRESRVWVRETFTPLPMDTPCTPKPQWKIIYAADGAQMQLTSPAGYNPMLYNYERWTPSIHMPRWVCRDVYTVTKVRIERLQDITEADAYAEGIEIEYSRFDFPPRMAFAMLWDSINGKKPGRAWKDNPWVWVVEYDNPLWEKEAA